MDLHEVLSILNNSDDDIDWNNSDDEDSTDGEEEALTTSDWLDVAAEVSYKVLLFVFS